LELYLYYSDDSLVTENPFTSVNKAEKFLGSCVDRRDFYRYINLENFLIRAPNLNNQLIRIFDPLREMIKGIPRFQLMIDLLLVMENYLTEYYQMKFRLMLFLYLKKTVQYYLMYINLQLMQQNLWA